MKKALAFLLIALVALPPLYLAQEKPQAALGRVAALGEISETQKKIILTRVESRLSKAYDLISQEQFARAEEAAFASLDIAQCTEEQCIRRIQEILQVDRLFILQIIREGEFTQLSLNLIREDSKRVVERVCDKCSIAQLYNLIDEVATQLIAEDLAIDVKAMVAEQPEAKPEPATPLEKPATPLEKEVAQIVEEEEGGISFWWWVLGGVVLAAAASGGGGGDEAAPAATPASTPTPTGTVAVTY